LTSHEHDYVVVAPTDDGRIRAGIQRRVGDGEYLKHFSNQISTIAICRCVLVEVERGDGAQLHLGPLDDE
jgi:hypothetical protein